MIDNSQLAIVQLHGCTALLLAGPGCGKTHILARRVFNANEVYGVPFESMLCLTFTNRAAREMATRVHSYLGYYPAGLFIGNIHSFCLRFLHANRLINPDTSIIDDEELNDYLFEHFGFTHQSQYKEFLDTARYIFERDNDFPEYLHYRLRRPPTDVDYERVVAFNEYKEQNLLLTYDDLLLHTYRALMQSSADYAYTGYTWLQVDEVQDMTPLQLAIVNAVCRRGRRTALYLGDEQQAIFSFLGAGERVLDSLKDECDGNIHHLGRNYRSAHYLVNLCNHIAARFLHINHAFLPQAVVKGTAVAPLQCWNCHNSDILQLIAAAQARRLLEECPDENVAILVQTNYQGQAMADMLKRHGFDFFHVSRPDAFHRPAFKTVWAHLAVVLRPTCSHEWARILFQTRAVRTLSGARRLMNLLRDSGMSGEELLSFDNPTTLQRFVRNVSSNRTIVVFDTETTGLDVAEDDIVQIAAVKIAHGKIVPGSEFCVFIESDRPISSILGNGQSNPIATIYETATKLTPYEAFSAFSNYIGDDSILAGHNIEFDLGISRHNIERRTSMPLPPQFNREAESIDTLAVSRLAIPRLWSHKLANLIDYLGLPGVNSHNAVDDVAATAALLLALSPLAADRSSTHEKIKASANIRKAAARLEAGYGDFYRATRQKLTRREGSLTDELQTAYDFFLKNGFIEEIDHFDYFIEMVDRLIVNHETEPDFRTQAEAHLYDLRTYNESDLLANGIVEKRLSVMTVHKAKGLEMDNVIVADASHANGSLIEYLRLMYVAFSRARKRLFVGARQITPESMPGALLRGFRCLSEAEATLLATMEEVHS